MNLNKANIICLLWFGEFRGRNFKENDVIRLFDTVDKHIDIPFDFYCLTNKPEINIPGTCIPLLHNYPGWWSKIELHRPDLPKGRTLYLDLDTTIVRSLAEILDFNGDLVMFGNRMCKNNKSTGEGKKIVQKYQAGTMLFDSGIGKMAYIWNTFNSNPKFWMERYRSEQDMMGELLPFQPTFPDEWLMKLSELRRKDINNDTIVVTGQPKGVDYRNPHIAPWLSKFARNE